MLTKANIGFSEVLVIIHLYRGQSFVKPFAINLYM
jgi:hypothetical protein